MFEQRDRVAVVTGGAKGIGRGIAEALTEAGATVVIADIDAERGAVTADELGADFERTDVTSPDATRAMIDRVVARHGRLDIVSANTGMYPQAALADMTEVQWDDITGQTLIVDGGQVLAESPEALGSLAAA